MRKYDCNSTEPITLDWVKSYNVSHFRWHRNKGEDACERARQEAAAYRYYYKNKTLDGWKPGIAKVKDQDCDAPWDRKDFYHLNWHKYHRIPLCDKARKQASESSLYYLRKPRKKAKKVIRAEDRAECTKYLIEFENGDWYVGLSMRPFNKIQAMHYHHSNGDLVHLRMKAKQKFRIINLGITDRKSEAIRWRVKYIGKYKSVATGSCLNRKDKINVIM